MPIGGGLLFYMAIDNALCLADGKLWIDDIRPAPEGWMHVTNGEHALIALESGLVKEVSFDNDLGPDSIEGWELAKKLYEMVVNREVPAPQKMWVHSMNPVARERIEGYLRDIERFAIDEALIDAARNEGEK